MKDGRLSGLMLRVLRRVLPRDWAADIVRDLEVAHRRRQREWGRVRAGAWLGVQVVAFALRFTVAGVADLIRGHSAGPAHVDTLRHDVRHALRGIARAPAFHAAVVLTLALGIGVTVAIFSVVRTVLLDPLPHPDAERLLVLDAYPWTPTEIVALLPPAAGAIEELVAFYPRPFLVQGSAGPAEVEGAEVTPGFLEVMGARPILGRLFVDADAQAGAVPSAVLSWETWQRHLGGDANVVGRVLRVDGVPREIVGVAERGFRLLAPRTDHPGIWVPSALTRLGLAVLPEGSPSWTIPVARLAADAPPERAQSALDAAVEAYREAHPEAETEAPADLRWMPLSDRLTRDARPALLVLQGAVGLVLLLACANVANLLLARNESRRGETAVRAALGASRWRLVRQHLTTSVVLAGLGGVAALAVAAATLQAALFLAPPDLPRLGDVSLDASLILVALSLSLLTGLAVGMVPAVGATRIAPAPALKDGTRTSAGSRRGRRLARGLAVSQIALSLILLVGAGLLGRSFVELLSRPPGFRAEGVLAAPLHVPDHHHETVSELEGFYARLVDRIGQMRAVESVAVANNLPLERGASRRLYLVEGESEPREAQYGVVSPDYFRTLGIPLLRGRPIAEQDRRGAPPVAVIDEVMHLEVWPDVDPVGRRFRFVDEEEWITVVGVSAAVRGGGLAREPEAGFHISYRQRPATPVELGVGRNAVLLVRPPPGPVVDGLATALRDAVEEVDPRQPVSEITPLVRLVAAELRAPRFRAALLVSFAALGLLLAVTGIAGVVGHAMAERRHEFGVRRAMGATDRAIVGSVLFWGLHLAAPGVLVGLVGAVVLGRTLSSLLVGVAPADPATLLGSVVLLTAATLAACLVPALRVVQVDPTDALR